MWQVALRPFDKELSSKAMPPPGFTSSFTINRRAVVIGLRIDGAVERIGEVDAFPSRLISTICGPPVSLPFFARMLARRRCRRS
jgi:hypothetical protein